MQYNDIMGAKITILVDGTPFEAELSDTPSGRAVEAALPIESRIQTWGEEFYFTSGLGLELDETATKDVEVGDLAYWPEGDALCIFFGRTPASMSDKPVPYGPVNKVGKLTVDAAPLKKMLKAKKIVLKRNK